MRYSILIIIIIGFLSCSSSHFIKVRQDAYIKDSIVVCYEQRRFETSIAVSRKEMSMISDRMSIDTTIALDNHDFTNLVDFIKSAHQDPVNKRCDARIYVKTDTFDMCLSDFTDRWCISDSSNRSSRYMIYFIKWRCGYYNLFSEDEIKYDTILNEFGVPKDYHHISWILPPYHTKKIKFYRCDQVKKIR